MLLTFCKASSLLIARFCPRDCVKSVTNAPRRIPVATPKRGELRNQLRPAEIAVPADARI
jgi:hypothetical protein